MVIQTREEREKKRKREQQAREAAEQRAGGAEQFAETEKRRQQDAQEYIRKREKLASKSGISSREAGKQLADTEIAGEPERFVPEEERRQQEQEFLQQVEQEKAELAPTAIQREFIQRGGELTEEGLPVLNAVNEEQADTFRRGLIEELGYSEEQVNDMIRIDNSAKLAETSQTFRAAFLGETGKKITNILGRVGGPLANFGEDFLGVSPNDVVDIITNREDAEVLESALGKLGETFSGIRGIADAGGARPAKTIAELEQQETNIRILEMRIQQAVTLKPSLKLQGRYTSILAELDKTKIELQEARTDVLSKAREEGRVNLVEIQGILEELKK